MADSHHSRASPYVASKPMRKVKVASSNSSSNQQVHPAKATRPSPPPAASNSPLASAPGTTTLPKIERRGEPHSNNNSSLEITNGSSLAMAISPQAREIPAMLMLPSGPPPRRPISETETSPTTRSDVGGSGMDGPFAKAAWCTPRSPLTSHLESFFATSRANDLNEGRDTACGPGPGLDDANALRATPARLLSVEENLRATDELYRVDLDKLIADNDKFFEVSNTASQHIEGIQEELPQISNAFEQTTSALTGLSTDIAALHAQQESVKDKMLAQLDEVFNQGTDEKLALVEAHEGERAELRHAHESELQELNAQFRAQVDELESKYNAMERSCLDKLQQLQTSSAAQLAQAQQKAAIELATLGESAHSEREALELTWKTEVSALKESSQAELSALQSSSRTEYEALEAKSQAELSELELRTRAEYEELWSSSSEEIRALKEASASQLADATDKLTKELIERQQSKDSELRELRDEYSTEKARLMSESEQEIARLNMAQQEQFTRMEDRRILETTALQEEIDATNARFTAEIRQLTEQHASEREAMELATNQTVSSMTKSHAQELEALDLNSISELAQTVESYEAKLASANELHDLEVSRLKDESASVQSSLVDKYEVELTMTRDEAKREKDSVTLAYETEIDALKYASKELLEKTTKIHEASAAQLRDLHSARVLQFETLIRDHEKKFAETVQEKDSELDTRANETRQLQAQLEALATKHSTFVDQNRELMARREMDGCEREIRMLAVQQELSSTLAALEVTRKELRAAGEDRQVKANTILELTFVIKSRDGEVERLRNALLDSVKSVNQKTEILELTAESLSSKAKELEATKAALRKESGKLSQVEESMHHKEEIIEDTEMKIERMRLGMEALRLEMKRMQMDMKLQLEHTEGEMALKNGEISRLHAFQSELKQKNDFYQQSVGRLEESLSATQRQVDEAQRRIHLLKLEATQNADEAKKTGDLLLEKEQTLLLLGKDRQVALNEKQRVQIQLNNLTQVVTSLHERHERQLMLCEEIQTRFLRVLAETSAEKDERMRAEKHLLFLELAATKELVRHLEGVEMRLTESKKETEGQRTQVQSLESHVQELDTVVAQLREVEDCYEQAQIEIQELKTTVQENEHALACTHDKLRFKSEASKAGIAALSATVDELTEEKTQLSTEVEALKSDLEQQCACKDSLERELAALGKQREELTSALSGEKLGMAESIERMLSELSDVKAQFTQQLSDAAEKLHSTEDELQKLQSGYDLKAGEASVLQAQVSELELKLNNVEAEHEALCVKCAELEKLLSDEISDHLRDLKDSEHELLLKTQELVTLENDFEVKLSALQQEQASALRAFEEEKSALYAEHENKLRELQDSFAGQLQEKLAGLSGALDEREQLVADHFRQLNEVENARVKLEEEHEAALSALTASHSEELQRLSQELVATHSGALRHLSQEHASAITGLEEQLAIAVSAKEAAEKSHLEELERVQKGHEAGLEARLKDLEDSKARLAGDFEKQIETLAETTTREAELARLRVAEEHLRKLEDIVESSRVRDEQQLSAFTEARARLTAKEQQLEDAKQKLVLCEDQIAELQRTCEQTELELAESKQLVAVRTATIDNVRKELNALHEASASSSSGGGGDSSNTTEPSDQLLAQFRQQIDTHLWETYQVDRAQVESSKLETKEDFVECLKAFFKIRCSLVTRGSTRSRSSRRLSATSGGGGLVMSVSNVCSRLEGYHTMAEKINELDGGQRGGMRAEEDGAAKLSDRVIRILMDHKRLVEHIQSSFVLPRSSPESAEEDESIGKISELEALIQSLEAHAELLNSLGLLKEEKQRARCDQVLSILEQHDSVMQHAAESSERLQVVELRDFTGLLDCINKILALARTVSGEDERFQTLADLKSLVTELETLHSGFEAAVGKTNGGPGEYNEPSEVDPEQATSFKSMGILSFVRDSTRFITDCRVALEMTPELAGVDSHSSSSSNNADMLVCIQELMQVLHHFDAFQPASSNSNTVSLPDSQPKAGSSQPSASPATSAGSNSSNSAIQEKVTAVLTFFDELHLMTDFAQNILDEECDDGVASMTGSQSNTSSSASLGMFRSLTRTPTSTSLGFNGDSEGEHSELLQIEVPFPLDELELELQDQHSDLDESNGDHQGFFPEDDGSQPAAVPTAGSPLAESLMDISLVMNDHHRIISEAAYWVHKTAKLRQRRRSSKLRAEAAPRSDLGSEICRLVREHCALLSLAKQLFKLKDPRHDLSSLLECLAILKRLTTRLPVFQSEPSSQSQSNSDSSTSLASNSSSLLFGAPASNTGSQDSLQTSLSVFACIEDIARHLQDYDFFLAQMRTNSDKQWLSGDATRGTLNVEVLTREINTRLEVLADTQTALGLQNTVLELPKFVQSVQEMVMKTESLEPWKRPTEAEVESAQVPDDDLGSECGRSETSEAHTEVDTLVSTAASPGVGLEVYTDAFEKIKSDLTTYTALMGWLRRVLPFSQSVESVDDMKERVQEVLSQLEVFANENVAMKDEIVAFQAEKERNAQQLASEDAFLADRGVVVSCEATSLSSRLEIFRQLLDEQRRLATKTGEVEASAFLETNFLVQNGLFDASSNPEMELRISTHMRLEIYKKLMTKVQQRDEATRDLEMTIEEQAQRAIEKLDGKEHALQELHSAVEQANRDEKAFLREHECVLVALSSEDDDVEANDAVELQVVSRVPVFEKFVSEIVRLQEEKRLSDSERDEERGVLQALGLMAAVNDEPRRSPDAEAIIDTGGDGAGDDTSDEAENNAEGCSRGEETSDNVETAADEAVTVPPPPVSHARRLTLYKELAGLQALIQAEKAAVEQEKSFLEANKLEFDANEPALSRMSVYRTLLDGQNALIDERMEREVEMGKESGFLASHGVDCSSRMDVFETFVKLRDEVAERNQADAMERTFLLENKLWIPEAFESAGDDDDQHQQQMDAQEQFGVRFQVFSEFLEAKGTNQQAKQQREAAVEAEKEYLLANASLDASNLQVDGPQYSRLHIYETLLAAQREGDAQREADQSQQLERFPTHEGAFLRSNGLKSVLDTSDSEPASALRTKVYEELFHRIRQRDETIAELSTLREKHEASLKTWDEVALEHADVIALAESEKQGLLATIADRESLISCLKDEFAQDQTAVAERQAAEVAGATQQHVADVETAAENHATEMMALTKRHAELVRQLTIAHEEKLAGLLASSKLELTAALEKQAKQLEFLVLVRAGEENLFVGSNSASSSSALSPAQARALLLDKVTKRDSSAISMIYKSIRLATDILNTSAFTGLASTSTTSNSSSEMIPVEVTQAVLNCVKELKALKEFLIESLEQLTRNGGDDGFPSQPPAFVKVNIDAAVASGDKEAAIDFALCSHREFMAFAHLALLKHQNSTDAGIAKLLATLKAVAGGSGDGRDAFAITETQFMELKMQLAVEKEAHENAECKFRLNDEYYQRLLGERKAVEATLTRALSELRDECRALRMKVDALEQERYAAPGSSSSSGSMFSLSPSPRATAMTPSGGFHPGGMVTPIRPEKPREPPPRTVNNKGAGTVHKERFVSDLEKETGQRRSTNTTRRINEWKKQDALGPSSSSQLERDFRAMETSSAAAMNPYAGYAGGSGAGTQAGKTSPTYAKGGRGLETAGGAPRAPTAQDQELWYQGVRMVHHISFFVSMFYVQKQHLFRVEVFNSDTEQQQTVYVTWSEMQTFLDESKKALKMGLALDDTSKHAEIADVLFERVRVYGEGSSNVLLGFE